MNSLILTGKEQFASPSKPPSDEWRNSLKELPDLGIDIYLYALYYVTSEEHYKFSRVEDNTDLMMLIYRLIFDEFGDHGIDWYIAVRPFVFRYNGTEIILN